MVVARRQARRLRRPRTPYLARGPAVDFGKDGVEPAQTAKTRLDRDLGHRQARLVDEPLGPLHPCSPAHLRGTCLQVTANSRVSCLAPTPRRAARPSTVAPFTSSAPSSTMSRSALSTVALLPIHALQNGVVSSRHRRHGRKPAASAAAADGKNETLADRAGRTGQIGRQ